MLHVVNVLVKEKHYFHDFPGFSCGKLLGSIYLATESEMNTLQQINCPFIFLKNKHKHSGIKSCSFLW